jgi:hypothetical protein
MGDTRLLDFQSVSNQELARLALLLKQLVAESRASPEPPGKWAVLVRFRIADEFSPLIVQIREHLMDLFAYRDDAHLSAARPHFNNAGIIWLVLGSLWEGVAVNARLMAEKMAVRGYDESDYEIAIQAAIELGWAEPGQYPGIFRLTAQGQGLYSRAEQLTNTYFYAPWSVLAPAELDELDALLTRLHGALREYRKSR